MTERLVAMFIIGAVFYVLISITMRAIYGKAMVTRLWLLLAPGVIIATQLTGLAAKLGETDIIDFNSFGPALAPYEPGDVVDLGIYRGSEALTIPVKLSKRPLPEGPSTATELAEKVREA